MRQIWKKTFVWVRFVISILELKISWWAQKRTGFRRKKRKYKRVWRVTNKVVTFNEVNAVLLEHDRNRDSILQTSELLSHWEKHFTVLISVWLILTSRHFMEGVIKFVHAKHTKLQNPKQVNLSYASSPCRWPVAKRSNFYNFLDFWMVTKPSHKFLINVFRKMCLFYFFFGWGNWLVDQDKKDAKQTSFEITTDK